MNASLAVRGLMAALALTGSLATVDAAPLEFTRIPSGPACTADGKVSEVSMVFTIDGTSSESQRNSLIQTLTDSVQKLWPRQAAEIHSSRLAPKSKSGAFDSKATARILGDIEEDILYDLNERSGAKIIPASVFTARAPEASPECEAQAKAGGSDRVPVLKQR